VRSGVLGSLAAKERHAGATGEERSETVERNLLVLEHRFRSIFIDVGLFT